MTMKCSVRSKRRKRQTIFSSVIRSGGAFCFSLSERSSQSSVCRPKKPKVPKSRPVIP